MRRRGTCAAPRNGAPSARAAHRARAQQRGARRSGCRYVDALRCAASRSCSPRQRGAGSEHSCTRGRFVLFNPDDRGRGRPRPLCRARLAHPLPLRRRASRRLCVIIVPCPIYSSIMPACSQYCGEMGPRRRYIRHDGKEAQMPRPARLACDCHQRHRVQHGVGQAGHQVGGARPCAKCGKPTSPDEAHQPGRNPPNPMETNRQRPQAAARQCG